MADYIDREKIISKTCSNCTRQIDLACQYEKPCEYLIAAFLNEDAADVAPVVHARWVNVNREVEQMCRCSACGYPVSYFWSRTEYCPHCGAKMDG